MKKIFKAMPLLLILLMGCQSLKYAYYDRIEIAGSPQLKSDVKTTFTFDKFTGERWLLTDNYMSWFQSGHNGIAYKFRAYFAHERSATPEFIQLYFTLKSPGWYFIENVYNEHSVNYTTKLINRDIDRAGNIYEEFAIILTYQQLSKLTKSNLLLKIEGKKGEETFPVSKLVAQSFHEALSSRSSLKST